MKKTVILLTISLFITTVSVSAQWFSIGAKGGYSATLGQNNSVEDLFNVKNNLQNGFHLGLYARMGRTWYVQPEALFNYYNYKSSIDYENSKIHNNKKYQINTIDVPVLLGVHLINTNIVKIRAMVGPKFSFNIGSTVADTFNDIETLTETLRNTRLGLDCGIGFDIWRITLDVRYNLIQDIYKYQNSEGSTLNKNPLHSFQASIGYRIIGNNKKKNNQCEKQK
jgi:hypothetical protein